VRPFGVPVCWVSVEAVQEKVRWSSRARTVGLARVFGAVSGVGLVRALWKTFVLKLPASTASSLPVVVVVAEGGRPGPTAGNTVGSGREAGAAGVCIGQTGEPGATTRSSR